jgi:uncharacterized Rmd1/YagE family protein
MKDLSPARFLVVADALAKTVSLARDEREVNAVFDVIEPVAAQLAARPTPCSPVQVPPIAMARSTSAG